MMFVDKMFSIVVLKDQHGSKKSNRYTDFLDILLTACDEDGQGLTNLEIRDEVDTFLFEGDLHVIII